MYFGGERKSYAYIMFASEMNTFQFKNIRKQEFSENDVGVGNRLECSDSLLRWGVCPSTLTFCASGPGVLTWASCPSLTKTKAQDPSCKTLGHQPRKMKDREKNENFLKTNFYFKDIIQMQ